MTDARTTGSAKVQNLLARLDVNVIETSEDTSSKLAPERIPHPVLGFCAIDATFDGYALLAIDGLPGDKILRDQHVILAFGDEHSRVPVGFENRVGTSFSATPPSPRSATASTTAITTSSPTPSSPIASPSTKASTASSLHSAASNTSTCGN